MEIRDKIKLKGKNNDRKITKYSQTKPSYNLDKNENDNLTTQKVEENEMKLPTNYQEIIVNNNIYNLFN